MLKEIFNAKDKSFRNMLFVVFFAYSAFAAIEAFFSSFATIYMGKTEGAAATLFLAYSIPMILTAYFWGLLGQKIGRKKAARFGLFGIIIGALLFIVFVVPNVSSPIPKSEDYLDKWDYVVMVNLAIVSMAWMCFIVNSFPIIWALAPKGKIGAYTGIYYTFNQFAYTVAPIVAGLNLDYLAESGTAQYLALFPLVFVLVIISFLFMLRVKSGDKQLSEDEIKEYREKYQEAD
jgi:MFS family permease